MPRARKPPAAKQSEPEPEPEPEPAARAGLLDDSVEQKLAALEQARQNKAKAGLLPTFLYPVDEVDEDDLSPSVGSDGRQSLPVSPEGGVSAGGEARSEETALLGRAGTPPQHPPADGGAASPPSWGKLGAQLDSDEPAPRPAARSSFCSELLRRLCGCGGESGGGGGGGAPPEREQLKKLAGSWAASGQSRDGPTSELLILQFDEATGCLSGTVDDGDGVLTEDDSQIEDIGIRMHGTTWAVSFNQRYKDGSITRWAARYAEASDQLLEGTWSGEWYAPAATYAPAAAASANSYPGRLAHRLLQP
jgi:hypothetical protein